MPSTSSPVAERQPGSPAAERQPGTPPAGPSADVQKTLGELDRLADLMDSAVGIPGTRFRLGLDGILGLIPGVGDAATVLPAAYIIYRAWQLRVPPPVLRRMIVNSGLDFAVGTVPLLGDVFDMAFKSNRRNLRILRAHFETAQAPRL